MDTISVQEHEETVMGVELDLTNRKLVRYLMVLERKVERQEEQIDRLEGLIIDLQNRSHALMTSLNNREMMSR